MDWLIPLLVISRLPRQRRAEVTEQLLPLALPGPASNRLAFAALAADRQVRRQAQVETQVVKEAVSAAGFTQASDLAPFPGLNAAFNRLDAVTQADVFVSAGNAPSGGGVAPAPPPAPPGPTP